jgi:phosphoribosylformylglycinamidine synthase
MDFKVPGNLVYIVGLTKPELGGSHYYALSGKIGNSVPVVDAPIAKQTFEALSGAIGAGFVQSCHDLSEGGLAVALAEMAFAGEVGAEIDLSTVPYEGGPGRNDFIMFSESNSRFLVEVAPENRDTFEKALEGVAFAGIGNTTDTGYLKITGLGGEVVVSEKLADLKTAWKKPLAW